MTHSTATIANAFLNLSFASDTDITPMKIQKLIYLAHGYSLAVNKLPLVDELFEAWRFGPVLPSLYQSCKKYGNKPITHTVENIFYDASGSNKAPPLNDPIATEIICFVWETYGSMDPIELSDWTHEKDGPWDTVMHQDGIVFRNQPINNDLIQIYFKERMIQ